ncbi:DNA glycosylase [Artemisia annua]|uniref:DNA glycosylase n=1 Tax=Artemisia annua TaxID=35608 RepID=A0A2U1LMW4_ARTAN|nr:DNA glycosylase [Artemisia annua]
MCSSKPKLEQPTQVNVDATPTATMVSDINGRPVLQPATSNRVLAKKSLKKTVQVPPSPLHTASTPNPKINSKNNSPTSPKLKSPRTPAIKRSNINRIDSTSSISERPVLTPSTKCTTIKTVNKSGGSRSSKNINPNSLVVNYSSAAIVDAPGSIAAARREQVEVMKVQRKLKTAHYGRLTSAKYDSCSKLTSLSDPNSSINAVNVNNNVVEEKRCSFITPFSDPIYVAYHDEEWGVPIHDDKLLFELLVLTVAQVGSDWTKVLKKRQQFREAFSGFEAETVSKFTDKDITALSTSYGIEVGFIRGVVDNSNCILEIKKAFGSFDKYIWGFVNHKPIATNYKLNHKMPVKTSKSEVISKDMLRRGFRQVGPTVVHSFMQAVGLTNDHLTTCPRHLQCVTLGSRH